MDSRHHQVKTENKVLISSCKNCWKTDRTVRNDLHSSMNFLTYCCRYNRMTAIEVGSSLCFPFICNYLPSHPCNQIYCDIIIWVIFSL